MEVGKDNLRRIIGPQGSVIKGLEADSHSRLSIDDAGLVHIYSPTQAAYQTAVASIEGITGASIKVRMQNYMHRAILSALLSFVLQLGKAQGHAQSGSLRLRRRWQVWHACTEE